MPPPGGGSRGVESRCGAREQYAYRTGIAAADAVHSLVFAAIIDPVESGIVTSLARPGGNATGFMNMEPALSGKWLELLKGIAPGVNRVLVLVNSGNPRKPDRIAGHGLP